MCYSAYDYKIPQSFTVYFWYEMEKGFVKENEKGRKDRGKITVGNLYIKNIKATKMWKCFI